MKRKKRFKFIVSLIFTIGMLFMLGGCGSGGGGDADVSCKNGSLTVTGAVDCGSSSDGIGQLRPMQWKSVQYSSTYDLSLLLDITELYGPEGASIGNIIPGKYVAKGSYNLTDSQHKFGKLAIGFNGYTQSSLSSTDEFIIPDGQLTGSYELSVNVLKHEGTGNPKINLFFTDLNHSHPDYDHSMMLF